MFKNIIFDFDGTLADSWEVGIAAYRQLAGKYGYANLSCTELDKLKDMPIMERLKKIGLPYYRIPVVLRDIKKTYEEHQDSLHPFPGMRQTLLSLANRGFNLHVLSTNSRKIIATFLKAHNMDVFAGINSSPGIFGKHRSLVRILQKQAFRKEETLYVGDELRDIEACKIAGIKVLAVTWGYDSAALLEKGKPDYTADTPEEILEIVNCPPQGQHGIN